MNQFYVPECLKEGDETWIFEGVRILPIPAISSLCFPLDTGHALFLYVLTTFCRVLASINRIHAILHI